MFQSERQLDVPNRFQLGTKMDSCVVEFGVHAYDADKPYRAIKVRCRATEMELFKAYDDSMFNSQPVLKDWNDIAYVTLKVKADDPNIPLLTRDRHFLVIAYAKSGRWTERMVCHYMQKRLRLSTYQHKYTRSSKFNKLTL